MNLSIIIPVYLANQSLVEMTRSIVLHSIYQNANQSGVEIILVDDCSPLTHAAEEIVEEYRIKGLDIQLISNLTNLGYGLSVNAGVAAAKHNYLLLLNNDIYLTAGACQRMIDYFEHYKLGMIGPVMSDARGYSAQQTTCPKFVHDYDHINYAQIEKFSTDLNHGASGQLLEVNYLMGACMLTTKEIWDELGGLSKWFGKGYYEEVDLQARMRKEGYQLAVAKDVFVLHESAGALSPSFSLTKLNRPWLISRNSLVFFVRNGWIENWRLYFDWHMRQEWERLV